jgi:hypothetical protein
MLLRALIACAKPREVATRIREAERTVRSAADTIGIMVVLAVIFPKAHRTNLESATLHESQVIAARTRESPAWLGPGQHRIVVELVTIVVEPAPPAGQLIGGWILLVRHRLVRLIFYSS